ncbi:MAG TPA: hypothetical protein VN213_15865 [Solirubrobacteraceae bacterium]|nr:hypothetical protein [Solirubrobacteraceae bacterium]
MELDRQAHAVGRGRHVRGPGDPAPMEEIGEALMGLLFSATS